MYVGEISTKILKYINKYILPQKPTLNHMKKLSKYLPTN